MVDVLRAEAVAVMLVSYSKRLEILSVENPLRDECERLTQSIVFPLHVKLSGFCRLFS